MLYEHLKHIEYLFHMCCTYHIHDKAYTLFTFGILLDIQVMHHTINLIFLVARSYMQILSCHNAIAFRQPTTDIYGQLANC